MEAHGSGQSLPPHVSPLRQDDGQSNPAKRKRTSSPAQVFLQAFPEVFYHFTFLLSYSYHVIDYITFVLSDFL